MLSRGRGASRNEMAWICFKSDARFLPSTVGLAPSTDKKIVRRNRNNGQGAPQGLSRISSPFCFFAFLGSLCFPLTRQKRYFFAGVLIPAQRDGHPLGGKDPKL